MRVEQRPLVRRHLTVDLWLLRGWQGRLSAQTADGQVGRVDWEGRTPSAVGECRAEERLWLELVCRALKGWVDGDSGRVCCQMSEFEMRELLGNCPRMSAGDEWMQADSVEGSLFHSRLPA